MLVFAKVLALRERVQDQVLEAQHSPLIARIEVEDEQCLNLVYFFEAGAGEPRGSRFGMGDPGLADQRASEE